MEKLLPLTGFNLQLTTAEERPHQISLFIHTHRQTAQLLELAAHLARRGPLLVLDGGNCFNTYRVAATLYRLAPYAEVQVNLEHIRAARAFTCFQMAALIHQALPPPCISPSQVTEGERAISLSQTMGVPVLVLEFLTTFQDENIPLRERQRLLSSCLNDLRQLAQAAPVLVTVRQSGTQPTPPEMLARLEATAGEVWTAEPPLPAPVQPPLFAE